MAETFLFNIAEKVLGKIAILISEEVNLSLNVNNDLEKLQATMNRIEAKIVDAERQQHKNETLRICMWNLRDIFYDAEDVLDEFHCETLRKKAANHPELSIKVRYLASCSFPLSFSSKMGHKIKEINQRLGELATEWNSFCLVRQSDDSQHVINRDSYSVVNSSDVIGRAVDRDNLIRLLMKPSDLVIPIVGFGGLGKTTLAQFVYNDDRVTRVFPLKIWVCVSKEFNIRRLLKLMINSIDKEKNCEYLAVEPLKDCLSDLLKDKKFLLVLDDVWNEKCGIWKEFINLLRSMVDLSQSRIIVTTRSSTVASVTSSLPPYKLEGLPHEDCLALFKKCAFNDGGERGHPELMRIGEEIVMKCKGVPLAVTTLGSQLFSKTDQSNWTSIRDNEIWKLKQGEDDILPVLKLSYDDLPSYLRRCLAFLSMFKKGHIYSSFHVIQLWMAHGLLECSNQEEPEDVGRRYLQELWSRCFIQDVFESGGSYFSFKVHDLIHDLALQVSQKEFETVNCQTDRVEKTIRHLCFCVDRKLPKVSRVLKKLKKVRTIISQETMGESVINFCISNFKYLRALDLSDSSLETLPCSICTLKHLRYLDLRGSLIRKLPGSFCKLQSLLTLRMLDTRLKQLPDSVQSLVELRHLEITIEAKHLKEIRPGCWSSLRYLGLYRCCNLECLFEGMQHLTSLRTLSLLHCSKLITLPRSLKFLTKLEELHIFYCDAINLQMEPEEEEDRPIPLSLKFFSVTAASGLTDLPQLLLEGSSTTLQHIIIKGCGKFEALPEWLQNLTSLQKLEIQDCPKLSALPEGMKRLTQLRQLKIEGCPTLSQIYGREVGADWHRIANIPEVDIK